MHRVGDSQWNKVADESDRGGNFKPISRTTRRMKIMVDKTSSKWNTVYLKQGDGSMMILDTKYYF